MSKATKKSSTYDKLVKEVYESRARYKEDWTQVAVLSGPTMVIEVIVREVSRETKVDMDWSYQGGRGFVMADTSDKKKLAEIKQVLTFKVPQILLS